MQFSNSYSSGSGIMEFQVYRTYIALPWQNIHLFTLYRVKFNLVMIISNKYLYKNLLEYFFM